MTKRVRHGMSKTRVYGLWKGIRKRCYQKSYQHYDRYGGRGITMCEEWNDFLTFYKDMGDPPSDTHQIDRIDNEGNYEPSNCRWVTPQENCRNRSIAPNKTGYTGVVQKKSGRYEAYYYVSRKKRIYLGTFATAEEAYSVRIKAIEEYNRTHEDHLKVR